jgi:hypothetical protein
MENSFYSLIALLRLIFIISRAGPFSGNHAGTDGGVGTANRSKEGAIQRGLDPPQNLSAGATRVILGRGDLKIEMIFGCPFSIGRL